MISVPMIEPRILPRPPNKLAPPITTAAIALRLSVMPEVGDAAPSRLMTRTPSMPASRPETA